MKFYTYIILFLFSATGITAQTQFIKEYSANIYTNNSLQPDAGFIDQTNDGYVIGGRTSFAGSVDPILFTVDEHGDLTGLSNRYKINGFKSVNAHITDIKSMTIDIETGLTGRGYLLSGIMDRTSDTNLDRSSYLIKTNTVGDIQWSKKLRLEDNYGLFKAVYIKAVEQVSNESAIIVGTVHTGNAHNHDLVIIKLNTFTGDIDWHEEIYLPSTNVFSLIPHGITEIEKDNYYIYGDLGPENKHKGFILHIKNRLVFDNPNALPDNLEFKTFGVNGPNGTIKDLVRMGDKIVVATQNSSRNLSVFKMSFDLEDVEALSGGADMCNTYYAPNSFPNIKDMVLHNNRLVINGDQYGGPSSPAHDNFTLVLSASGDVIKHSKNYAPLDVITGKNSFSEENSFIIGNPLHSTKFRLYAYSNLGETCEGEYPSIPRNTGVVSSNDLQYEMLVREKEYPNIPVSKINHPVSMVTICEGCFEDEGFTAEITTSTGETTFCEGGSLTLFAPPGFVSYQWFKDGDPIGTGEMIDITDRGSYSVVCIDTEGCEVEVFIDIYEYQECIITSNFPDLSFCSIAYPASYLIGWSFDPLADCPEEYIYSWTHDGTPIDGFMDTPYRTLFVGTGYYEVTVTTPCSSQVFGRLINDDLVVYIDHPFALSTFVGYSGTNALFKRLNSFPIFPDFLWTVCDDAGDVILTSTEEILEVPYTTPGEVLTIKLTLYDRINCIEYTNTMTWSDGPSFRRLAQEKIESLTDESVQFQISPNPASDRITINIKAFAPSNSDYLIEVYNANGARMKTLFTKDLQVELSLNDLNAGLYLIKLSNENNTYTQKLIKY